MLKVMIVDDERIIRYGIISMVHWEKLGLELVGEASEGKEGYELFLQKRPDIVITDLKMPELDGLEMVRRIKETDENVKFIILSGYEDFSYAKEAIHLGVSEYLLKSDLMPEDIEHILEKVMKEIRENGAEEKEKTRETKVNIPKLIEESCKGICLLPRALPGELKEELNKGYCCLCIGRKEIVEKDFENNLGIYNHEIKNQMEKWMSDYTIYLFYWGKQVGAVVFYREEDETDLNNALEKSITEMEKQGMVITIGRSPHGKQLDCAHELFKKALVSYDQRAFYGYGKVIKVARKESDGSGAKDSYPVNRIEKLVEYDKQEELVQFLEEIFETIKRRKKCEELALVSMDLLLILNKIAAKVKDIEEVFQWKKDIYDQYLRLELVDDIKEWFVEKFVDLQKCKRRLDERSVDVVDYIEDYIKEHYDRKLSLQDLSEMVGLNKNYLSALFKKKTGKNIGNYITEVKIEQAKEFMKSTTLRMNVIAEKVGYEDERYFYKVFKSYTGITTTEYMRQISKELP